MAAFCRNSTTWVTDFRCDGRPHRWFKVFGERLDPTRQVQVELRALRGNRVQWVGARAASDEEESPLLRGEDVGYIHCPTGRSATPDSPRLEASKSVGDNRIE